MRRGRGDADGVAPRRRLARRCSRHAPRKRVATSRQAPFASAALVAQGLSATGRAPTPPPPWGCAGDWPSSSLVAAGPVCRQATPSAAVAGPEMAHVSSDLAGNGLHIAGSGQRCPTCRWIWPDLVEKAGTGEESLRPVVQMVLK